MKCCYFGEFLDSKTREIFGKVTRQPHAEIDELYRKGVSLKEGDGRNLRETFKLFNEASGSGHREAYKELAEGYLYG